MTTVAIHFAPLTPRQWAGGLNALLLLALLFSLWRWLDVWAPAEVHYQRPETPPTASPAQRPAGSVADLHLFGRHDARALADKPPPRSRLQLSLQGTLLAADRRQHRAFIADARGEQRSYGEQDELPGGARLLEIHRDHVILLRNGVREALYMEHAQRMAERNTDPAAVQTPAYQGGPLEQAPPIPGLRSTQAPAVTVNNAQLSVAQLKLDPARLARQVHAMPVRRNGKLVGYRLRAGRYATVLQRLGVQPQDVITEVNGQSLTDPAAAMMLMNSLQQNGPIQLTIERDGQPRTVTIDLDS